MEKKNQKNKNIDKGLENYNLESLCLADFTCLPPKWKSADNVYDREERLTTSYVKTLYTCTYSSIYESYAEYICFIFQSVLQ